MGTPEFAATILRHVAEWGGCELVAVYTQPDRPCGRGQVCRFSEVKTLALELDIPVYQPLNFRNEEDVETLRSLRPDVLLVAAYGLILPQKVLDIPTSGAINVHASLLPKYRGAAPIQRAIMNGDPVTGVTIMQMERGLDTGPILMQRAMAIGIADTAGTMHDQLSVLGGRLLVEALELLPKNGLHAKPQDDALSTHAAKLEKTEGIVDWNQPAKVVHARIRGVHPWPGAFFVMHRAGQKDLRIAVEPGEIGPQPESGAEPLPAPGTVMGLVDDRLAIATADRVYYLSMLRPANKKAMSASAFFCGYLNGCDDATCSGEGLC